MTIEEANKVYDILVKISGSREYWRDTFIYDHVIDRNECTEWRFQGKLGFGGKYRSRTNTVDCYKEDETSETLEIMRKTNEELSKLKLTYKPKSM